MPEMTYSRQQIALDQLETALRLFREGEDLLSVITLAGAAEEVLGKLVGRQGGSSSLAELTEASIAMYRHLYNESSAAQTFARRANRVRNLLKHFGDNDPDPVRLDAQEEAMDMLNRAIDNYWTLTETVSPAMQHFVNLQRTR